MGKLTGKRRELLALLLTHGPQLEDIVASRTLGKSMHFEGLVTRTSGTPGKQATTLAITEAGKAALRPQDVCECKPCRLSRP